MNVASLEPCRELYGLSGWADTPYVYYKGTFDKRGERSLAPMNYQLKYRDWAYELGYLIRKLPEIRLETWHNGHVVIKYYTAKGVPSKIEGKGEVIKVEADTPEDAAAKLAIELFKQGILKPEPTQ